MSPPRQRRRDTRRSLLYAAALACSCAAPAAAATQTVTFTATVTSTVTMPTATVTETVTVPTVTGTVTLTLPTLTQSAVATQTVTSTDTVTVSATSTALQTVTATATETQTRVATETIMVIPPLPPRVARGAGKKWIEVQRLQDIAGQPHQSFGEALAVSDDGGVLVVGAPSANLAKGLLRVVRDLHEEGHAETARLRSPAQQPLDALGWSVALGSTSTGTVAVAGAPGSAEGEPRPGSVYVFRHVGAYQPKVPGGGLPSRVDASRAEVGPEAGDPEWLVHQRIALPPGELKESFGRQVALTGDTLVASAVGLQAAYAQRDSVSVVNRRGTWQFMEAFEGRQARFDSVYTFSRRVMRDNVTRFELDYRLQPKQPPVGLDFGHRLSLDSDGRFLAVSAPVRRDSLFGHGTDGHLEVRAVTTLDGTGVFNFRSVTVRSGGTLTVTRRNAASMSGGRLVLRVQETFLVEQGGVVNVSALGYEGGPASFGDGGVSGTARQGESPSGPGATLSDFNGGGGGAGTSQFVGFKVCIYDGSAPRLSEEARAAQPANNSIAKVGEASGGGGGYGTKGEDGTVVECGLSGLGGQAYGDPWLDTMDYGSGGGSGHPYKFGSGGAGGWGGGVIDIRARYFINNGTIAANGGRGQNGGYYSGGGGGGAGGSIRIQGEEFTNTGTILALGGKGGLRASGSGSDGKEDVKAGDGGKGRIRVAFISYLDYSGEIDPPAVNDTLYDGRVVVFERRDVGEILNDQNETVTPECGCEWREVLSIRPKDAFFVGHSVATEAGYVAFGSDQLTKDNRRSQTEVYIYRYNESVGDRDGNFVLLQVLTPPSAPEAPTSVRFGHMLRWNNATLLISSLGDEQHPGVLWIYRPYFMGSDETIPSNPVWGLAEWVSSPEPHAGDGFGLAAAHTVQRTHETLYVLSASPSFAGHPTGTTRETTRGGLHIFQFEYNVSAVFSTASCTWTDLTVNTSTLCTVRGRDVAQRASGWFSDARRIGVEVSVPAEVSPVVFVQEGQFDFVVRPLVPGPFEVRIFINSEELSQGPVSMRATPEIDPLATPFRCNDSAVAGELVQCWIEPRHPENATTELGEASAARHFTVTVVNTDEGADHPPFDQLIHLSDAMGAVERYVTAEGPGSAPHPLEAHRFRQFRHAPQVHNSPVTFVRPGLFEFRFVAALEGTYAVLVKYKLAALRFPNPAFIDVRPPPVVPSASSLVCQPEMPPNRTSVCAITLLGAGAHARTGWGDAVRNLSAVFTTDQGAVGCDHQFVWGSIGRVRLWFLPCASGSDGRLYIRVYHGTEEVPRSGGYPGYVVVTDRSVATRCQGIPHVFMTLATLRSEFYSRNDPSVFPASYTMVTADPREFCERWRL
eukprot:TRINITY_DN1986_c0_g1_i1.p1 TRINITY_DN1986_c0_g1~~TRINITY_DN1986_c0_g1_i1.p1  ORF type:complete len:1364 (+),score=383.40 TRINITY_DN1986_c0_g1_i1:109-4200(+)